ncbi:hypothetical protein Fcan01_15003 [Folsomia candida]|uniref:Uncharacterized protein n=1 Tax=Folsomia candida TaxID=158441 RepID=A0A226DYS7_FOLCA|nr:hypothetical protein Fcan01_15003 [Folsomia candida]
MVITKLLRYFWILEIAKLQACTCPKEWKYGLPVEICGKEITALNNDHSCVPQYIYNCTELGGRGIGISKMECEISERQFCEMEFSQACKTEECCKKDRRRRGCADAVARLSDRHRTLGKPGQYNPVSPSQYPAVRENACTCPKEWKHGLPAEICGKEITGINKDHSCEPQYVYNCTELGGVAIRNPKMSCELSEHDFCEIKSTLSCKTEECCRKQRLRRGCTYGVATLPERHLTLGKPGQPNPVSPSQYPAARENVFMDCLIKVSTYASSH